MLGLSPRIALTSVANGLLTSSDRALAALLGGERDGLLPDREIRDTDNDEPPDGGAGAAAAEFCCCGVALFGKIGRGRRGVLPGDEPMGTG